MEQIAAQVAEDMWAIARVEEQCARTVPDEATAVAVRKELRRLAASDGIEVRTARMGDAVIVVRLDAAVWRDDTATMRDKLTPRE